MKKTFAILTISTLTALCFATPVWIETANSTSSIREVTDGNFVLAWNTSNKRLYYVSRDSSVSTVCDMTTLCTDLAAIDKAGPTAVAANGFQNDTGITCLVFPEEIVSFY